MHPFLSSSETARSMREIFSTKAPFPRSRGTNLEARQGDLCGKIVYSSSPITKDFGNTWASATSESCLTSRPAKVFCRTRPASIRKSPI